VLVAIGGLSGTGKSALARTLAPALRPAPGAVVLRSDFERKALFGIAETDRLPPEGYAQAVTASVYSILAGKARRVAGAGHSVIADAVFARADERAAIAEAAQAARTMFYGLFLTADLATRVARIGARAHDASDADAAVARQQERYELGALDWTMIDASGSPSETLARAQAAIA
jgi:predicted kinase